MLDFGFSEILLTSAIALVVLGPERLPKVARQVGNWMGRARAMARQLSEQLEREVSAEELLREQSKPKAPAMTRIGPPHYVPPDPQASQLGPHASLAEPHTSPAEQRHPSLADSHLPYEPDTSLSGAPAPDAHTLLSADAPISPAAEAVLADPAADPHAAASAEPRTPLSKPVNE
jgi:sec-independent protein translocase protein TatB